MEDVVRRAALDFARDRYPDAELVVVAGSAAVQRRPRSDIDLVVIGPPSMFSAGDDAAYTERWRDELLEVFASTPEAFLRHLDAGVASFRPVSAFLLLDGVPIVDAGRTRDLLRRVRTVIDRGPTVSAAELDARRYAVTNSLDDLLDAEDASEEAVLAAALLVRVSEFVLLANGRWLASGRWLMRRLADLDRPFAESLAGALASRDVPRLHELTLQALGPFGGRLMEGYSR